MFLSPQGKAMLAVVSYVLLNVGLQTGSKALFEDGFIFPLLVLLMTLISAALGTIIMIFVFEWEKFPVLRVLRSWKTILVLAFSIAAGTAFQYESVVRISLSTNQMVKALM